MKWRAKPVLLARQMLTVLALLHIQQTLLRIIAIAGPATTQELARYCGYRVPGVSLTKIERLLSGLRKAQALTAYRISSNPADGVVWAVPGQPKPANLSERRRKVQSVVVERRETAPRESWWIQSSRDGFEQALERRWS